MNGEEGVCTWPRRIGRTVGTALIWALACAIAAVLLSLVVDPVGAMEEIWPAVGAYPGFIGGLLFSAVLWVGEARRGTSGWSMPQVAAWGAAIGVAVALLPFAVASNAELPPGLVAVLVFGSVIPASVASAVASALLFRRAARKRSIAA